MPYPLEVGARVRIVDPEEDAYGTEGVVEEVAENLYMVRRSSSGWPAPFRPEQLLKLPNLPFVHARQDEIDECLDEALGAFAAFRRATDAAQASLLLFKHVPDRLDLLEHAVLELNALRAGVGSVLSLLEEVEELVD